MATMVCPVPHFGDVKFEDVEESVRFVKDGVKFANRKGIVVRVFWKVALFHVFSQTIESQDDLIDTINGPATQSFNAEQLTQLTNRIECLVRLNDELLITAAPRTHEFGPWMDMLSKIRVQRDTLESITQSFRSASDPEHQALLVTILETM